MSALRAMSFSRNRNRTPTMLDKYFGPRRRKWFDYTADCLFARTRRVIESDRALKTSSSVICGLYSFVRSHCFVRRPLVDIVLDVFTYITCWRLKRRFYRFGRTCGCRRCRFGWTWAAGFDVVDCRRRRLRFSFSFLRLCLPGTLVAVVRDSFA